jgi:hypothetical protein
MRKLLKRRWVWLACLPVVILAACVALLQYFGGSAHINRTVFRELKLGMTYDEAHVLLGGVIHEVKPRDNAAGGGGFKYGYSEDHESIFPPLPTIWFTVDNDNRLTTKEYETASLKKIWDRLLAKLSVMTGRSPPTPPPMPPMPLPRLDA